MSSTKASVNVMSGLSLPSHVSRVRDHFLYRNLRSGMKLILSDKISTFCFLFLCLVSVMALVGPSVAPYHHSERVYSDGELVRGAPPSLEHPLGTTNVGHDVMSRVLYGALPTVITGLLGGTIIVTIGLTIGLAAGYLGGMTESILMRITDIAYGMPLIPFAIVFLAVFGMGFLTSILVIGMLLWRGSARVIRSQVLQIKQRPYIMAAKTTGSSTPRIIFKHILPNVAPMAVLFFAFGIGYTILLQANLAFIGVSNPFVPSWGIIVRNAYTSGIMTSMWWWAIPPGFFISLTVLSAFMLGRRYETMAGGSDDDSFVEMG